MDMPNDGPSKGLEKMSTLNRLKEARRIALEAREETRAADLEADWGEQSYWDQDWCARSVSLNCGEMDLILKAIDDPSSDLHRKIWDKFQEILAARGESV